MKAGSNSNWVERSLKSVWHPCTQMQHHESVPMIPIARGEGAYLIDMEGRRYLDAISSWWVNLFGHAHPYINAALKAQLDTLEHVMLAGFTHESAVLLAERLSAMTGHALGHCFFASDGASAVEIALKMSVHAWRNAGHGARQEFVCLSGSYHGETLGALSVTDVPLFREAYAPLLRHAHVVASPDARRAEPGESAAQVAARALADLEACLAAREGRVAAVIIEPLVQCAQGMVMHDPSYVRGVRVLCDRYGAHLIADEIAVGCGRTGRFFACQHAEIWPDFLCLSKGISGGYLPLSLVLSTEAVYQAFYDADLRRAFLHSHSYTGNPLACRAALATLDLYHSSQAEAGNRHAAALLRAALAPLADYPEVRHLRSQGMIFAFDVALPDPIRQAQFARRFFAAALERGALIRPIGTSVYLMPPYILDAEQIAHLGQCVQASLREVLA